MVLRTTYLLGGEDGWIDMDSRTHSALALEAYRLYDSICDPLMPTSSFSPTERMIGSTS